MGDSIDFTSRGFMRGQSGSVEERWLYGIIFFYGTKCVARRGASWSDSGIGLICSLWDLDNFSVTLQIRLPCVKRRAQDDMCLTSYENLRKRVKECTGFAINR